MSEPYLPKFMLSHEAALVHETVYAIEPAFCGILPQQVFLAVG